jgi:hypothetical protein
MEARAALALYSFGHLIRQKHVPASEGRGSSLVEPGRQRFVVLGLLLSVLGDYGVQRSL